MLTKKKERKKEKSRKKRKKAKCYEYTTFNDQAANTIFRRKTSKQTGRKCECYLSNKEKMGMQMYKDCSDMC